MASGPYFHGTHTYPAKCADRASQALAPPPSNARVSSLSFPNHSPDFDRVTTAHSHYGSYSGTVSPKPCRSSHRDMSNSARSATLSPFRFKDLPAELRNMVYSYIVGKNSDRPTLVFDAAELRYRISNFNDTEQLTANTALLHVDQQINLLRSPR
jgi:hypothetical protein